MASIPTNSQISSFLKTLRAIKGKPYERGFSLPGAFYTDPLWPQALLQMACFNGRNAGFTTSELDLQTWRSGNLEGRLNRLIE